MNIVFMGTPEIAVSCLKALAEAGHNIGAVFTQPDRPKNRGHKLQAPPVKEYALENGMEVYQPLSLKKGGDGERSLKILEELAPDCIVVVAYGQLLPKSVLDIPKYGCINVHASLLPRYRGAAPIQRAIMNGEKETGVTTMYMAEGLDTGDMILSAKVGITPDMTGGELYDKLSEIGAELIAETLAQVEKGTAPRIPQPEAGTCYAEKILKEDCLIDFSESAVKVCDKIRGLSPSPCAYTFLEGKRLKIYFARRLGEQSELPSGSTVKGEGLCVVCGGEVIRLSDIQLEGGKRMNDTDLLRGKKLELGTVLGR